MAFPFSVGALVQPPVLRLGTIAVCHQPAGNFSISEASGRILFSLEIKVLMDSGDSEYVMRLRCSAEREKGALTILSPYSFQFSKMAFHCVTKSREPTTNEFEYFLINVKLILRGHICTIDT